MERQISKIISHFDAIVEEKDNLQDNLDALFIHVTHCMDRIKNKCEISQQKIILSYELEVLKTLNEINFEVEHLLTINPLPEEAHPVIEQSEPSSSLHLYVPRNDVCNVGKDSSSYCQPNQTISQTNLSELDIQSSRNTLNKVCDKLGLSEETISSMKDFYDKPSSSRQADCFLNIPAFTHSEPIVDNFKIPEKDINTRCIEEPSCSEDVFTQETALYTSITNEASSDDMENKSNLLEDGETETEATTVIEVSSQLFINEDVRDLQVPSDIPTIDNQIEVDSQAPEVTLNTTNPLSSALDKLKNFHCDAPTPLNVEPLHISNIMLKPTKLEYSSKDVQRTTDGSRKKRNKKNKNGNNGDDMQYVLKQKTHPKIGDECAFSHVESPAEFYIHIVDDESALIDSITDQINEYYQGTLSVYNGKEECHNAIGSYCFVYIQDYDGWFRAKVINWFLDKKTDEVLVLLVDFGNKRMTSYKKLRKMYKEIAEIPMLAVKCHFPLMYPPGSTALKKKTEWPPETIDAMCNISGLLSANQSDNKLFKIVFSQYCAELNSLAVDLFNLENEDDEITVGQMLLDLGLCEQIIDSTNEEHSSVEEFLQDIDTLENAANVNEAVMEYNPRDEARICRFTKPDGTCYKGNNCKLEHIALPKDGFTTDKVSVFKEAMYDLVLPLPNEAVTILITGYIDICNFYAQIVRTPHREKKYILDKDFYTLLEDMNYSKMIRTYEPLQVLPAVGEIVMVKHNLSKKWLRAVVRDRVIDKDDDVQIFGVDFGDYLKVKLSELRKIKPHFLKLPFQAVNCYIGNYKFKKNCSHPEAKAFFFKNLYFINFIACSLSSSLPLKIRLQSMNGFDIGKELEKRGFAEKRLYDSNPSENCILML